MNTTWSRCYSSTSTTNSAGTDGRCRDPQADLFGALQISNPGSFPSGITIDNLLVLHEVRTQGRVTTERAAALFQVPEGEARGY